MMFFMGIFIHLVFMFSIFDIYFKSPIVRNVEPYPADYEAVADRLVLFVVDGLRAESFLNYTTMPYLRSVANTHGRWGISYTRVPTESRPGHVAVIAGFYEDPSAVAKGWKSNPVDFDSVFNQTQFTWCWGAYDIIEIFTKGVGNDRIMAEKFDPYDQAFSTDKNTTLLDAWVFEKVKQFFETANHDQNLREKLFKKKISFFLHLLGSDTSGHTHKPKTENFLTTLRFVDEQIRDIEGVIRKFYKNDGKTAFLMTSDHGMTDWGSHGSGDEHETHTPYVLWGAGVKQVTHMGFDFSTNGMSLNHRLDVNQVDLTPLMASILSIPVPVNSVGQVPIELLDMSLENKAKAVYCNCRQLASQYDKKRSDVESKALRLLYYPYEPFSKQKYKEMIDFTDKLLKEQEYEKLIVFSEEVIRLSLSGLDYYHNYYQVPLLILVTLSFLGWIANLFKMLSEQSVYIQTFQSNSESTSIWSKGYVNNHNSFNFITNIAFFVLFVIAVFLVYVQNLPVQYYVYFTLPILLWRRAVTEPQVWIHVFHQMQRYNRTETCIKVLSYTSGCLAMGLSLTYRWMLSVPLVGMAVWPFFTRLRFRLPVPVFLGWSNGCILLSIFSFMPVVGKKVFIELVIAAGIIWLLSSLVYIRRVVMPLYRSGQESAKEVSLCVAQSLLLALSLLNIHVQSSRFQAGAPVSKLYQAQAWLIAGVSLVLPLTHSTRVVCRLHAVYTSLLNLYLLLSVSHEALFTVTLIVTTACWLYIENRLARLEKRKFTDYLFVWEQIGEPSNHLASMERSITSHDFRRAFFFILYIVLAFFGTGNIASLNSFEVRWVTCFITSFQPFIITTLILMKTLAPFLIVACSFRAVQLLTKAPVGYLNIIVLIYSNVMGIQLLYHVKNTGSWLEIGTSISQFVIVQLITLFIVLINQIAKIMTEASFFSVAVKVFKSRKKNV